MKLMQFAAKGKGASPGSCAVLGALHEPQMIYYRMVPECPLPLKILFCYLASFWAPLGHLFFAKSPI